MAFELKLGKLTIVFLIILVIGYVMAILSLLDGNPKMNLSLENQIERLKEELHTLRRIEAVKDVDMEAIKAQLEKGKSTQQPQQFKQNRPIRPGVIVLGMHRSGTSILGGLLNKLGLKTGGPLIRPNTDNEKGFFERLDVVLQNDMFMGRQNVNYGSWNFKYDPLKALGGYFTETGPKFFAEGRRALAFLNDPGNYPWMLKDPRLCITIRTWLPLLNFVPAVLFTYRHPYDVAMSLHVRYEQYKIARGLKLWYIYNKRAIQQTRDLCRVVTSHHVLMKNPDKIMSKIKSELLACGVQVPLDITTQAVAEFIDIKLQHGKIELNQNPCDGDLMSILPPDTWATTDEAHVKLYREVMRVYCALEDGSAYSPDFPWDESIEDHDPW